MSGPDSSAAPDARVLVDQLLADAVRREASDIHLEPTASGLEIRLRIDGLLETAATHERAIGQSMVTRLMVMAQLLTYRLDVPQEGRASVFVGDKQLELRISIMPTTHGLRAAVRMPAELMQPRSLAELGLPANVMQGLEAFVHADAGMLIVTGPAGSGKTTSCYALLQSIAQSAPGISLVSLEDPVERDLPGVTQIEVEPFGELTYERTLRSMLRQDPQVLMLGEIRDPATASIAAEAALSGHRLVSTMHAATPAGAIARLLEMGVPPYVVSSAIFGVASQRLLRRKADGGYRGRMPVTEFVRIDDELRRAILRQADANELEKAYSQQSEYRPMRAVAGDLVNAGLTDAAEARRVLGE
jgi:type II secretory ATPase GspE/PulE/Tfp pilus assembly ATPase PilB-like protein